MVLRSPPRHTSMLTDLPVHTHTQAIAICMVSSTLPSLLPRAACGPSSGHVWACSSPPACSLVVVALSGSVALLADTIHNFGDAATALPLWVAFPLARRRPTERFTYGFGRFEDLAGLAIVLIMALSALLAGYETVTRLIHPQPVAYLGTVAVASIVGFLGNEAVALFRIKVGQDIGSAALIADGYHARVDGWTSLAVLVGALGVWLGYPLADPVVGLLITVAILWLVWQSARWSCSGR